MAAPSDTGVHKLIVGVDFGTTFTGISWVSTQNAQGKELKDVDCIRDWPGPGRDGDYSWKAPSRIAYPEAGGASQGTSWGYSVTPKMKSYAWMKLLLDPTQATKFDDPSLTQSEGSGVLSKPLSKSAVQICADYLTEVARFAHHSLSKRLSAEVLALTPLEFWFTVPAVWSDKAKADTLLAARKAAKQAGLHFHADTQVFLIREPEAAAVATVSYLTQGGSDDQIAVGDSIMVCDAGGGTVDITTYEITVISPKLIFKELLVGTGGKCGSTYIDREFIKWMEKKFGKSYNDLSWEKRGPASRLMKDFEGHKRDFGKLIDSSLYYEVQVYMKDAKDSKYYDEDDGIVRIYQEDMKAMFEPVIAKVIALLQSQLDAERMQAGHVTIKTIILVGGFGDSSYLNNALQKWCGPRGIKLLCPEHPQSAIVRGAALSGLHNIQPTSRRSRLHYGWDYHEAWDPMRHHRDDYFIWDWDGTARAGGNMMWELNKGDLVEETTEVKFGFNQTVYEDNRSTPSTLSLYCSSEDDAPHYRRDAGVRNLAMVSLDFSKVDMRQFSVRTVRGRRLRHILCDVVVHFGHRRGVLVFTCTSGGKEIGTTSVTFDGESTSDLAEGLHGIGTGAPSCGVQ
ncbi:hypothetical protein BST61_g1536 [Cercospora zeina]